MCLYRQAPSHNSCFILMKYLKIIAILLTSFLALVSCEMKTADDTEAEKEKIRNLFQTWVKDTAEKGDAATYFKYVTPDFMVSEPNSPVKSNRDSIASEVKIFLADNSIRLENWISEEIIIRQDIAIHRHAGVLVIMPKSDTSVIKLHLKYLDILKKDVNGEWKTYLHSSMMDG